MQKKYNIPGKVDRPNTRLINRILQLKGEGNSFSKIATMVNRSDKRVKDLYYREVKKTDSLVSLDNK